MASALLQLGHDGPVSDLFVMACQTSFPIMSILD